MALGQKLQLRQSQSLVMTPQLLQSIKLLQMPSAELERFIDAELERNPLLERAEAATQEDAPEQRAADGEDWFSEQLEGADILAERFDASLENVFPDDPGRQEAIGPDLALQWRSAAGSGSAGGEAGHIEDYAAERITLRDHVGAQVALSIGDPVQRLIALELAGALDDDGYLRADLAEFAERLGVDEEAVASVLAVCQTLEPAGLFARDLAECLSLQLKARDRFDPAMAAMVANLELLAQRDFARLRQICGVDDEDLGDMLAEIRSLDPRPGLCFGGGTADPVVPDVIVSPAHGGGWSIELNPDALPKVLVDQSYYTRVSAAARGPAEKEFLSGCLQSANWLTRSLDQRARTILKVAGEIVRHQDAFMMHGVRHLRPLNLKTVAEAIGMHESTVSRVTSNKYMMTPRGVLELRYFFTAAIPAAGDGEAHSSEAVRVRIRDLIAAETPANILSDDAIVEILGDGGIEIARRTVAKYRDSLRIPSSVQRRREKRLLAGAV